VTSPVVPVLSEIAVALCVVFILLVPFAAAGLSLINTGLGRSRSAAHSMMASLCMIAVAALAYFVCGFAWQGFPGRPAHVLTVAGRPWDWIAAEPFFLHGVKPDGSPVALVAWFEMLSVGLVALIPLGAGGDRWRLGASCASTALLAGWTYPLFAHWVWGGGWLAQLGFVDAGGSGSIHALGGLTALAITWIIGPRRGKYAPDGMPAAIPGHNTVIVLFGCLLALLGWLGLNSAGAILFNGAEPGRVALIGINTLLAASSAALTAAGITRLRFGRPDASLCANGWVAGLVSSSAGCAFVPPAAAVMIGMIAGALTPFAVELFELHLAVDDPGGVISVHAVSGIWGLLALGLFANLPGQWLAQLVGIATLIGFVLPLTYGLNWLLNLLYRYRVAPEGERQGMDLYELGAGAYPEFLTHNEDFTQR
jgi:Amt family ammonium transporter